MLIFNIVFYINTFFYSDIYTRMPLYTRCRASVSELNVSSECRMEFECTQRLYIEHRAGYGYNVTIYGMIPDVAGRKSADQRSVYSYCLLSLVLV